MKNVLILLFTCVQILSCSKSTHPDYFGTIKPSHPADEIVVNGASEPQYLDPTLVSDSSSRLMTSGMFVRLVESHPQTGEIIPDLAQSWDVSKDGLEYTFHLREAVWSDGKPLTAYDVEYAWKRLANPKTASTYIQMVDVFENGRDLRLGKTTEDKFGVKAVDDHTLKVKLIKPVPYFLGMIEYMVFAPVPKHIVEKFKAEGKENLWVRPENIVVSGPFQLVEEQFKQYKVYKKNLKYYSTDKVKINKVKVLLIEDYTSAMNAYKTGQHDWSAETSIPTDMLESIRKYKDYHFDPMLTIYFYIFNTLRKPLDDVRVRNALSLAIDRKMIVERITKQGQIPSRDLVAKGIANYIGAESSIYEPETAKKLLAEAGFPGGKGFPKMTIKFNTSEGHRKIAEAIQEMWRSTLGIQIDIANMEFRTLLEDQNQKNFDIVRFAWVADYMDPHTFMQLGLSESENNKSGWKNKKYDELISQTDQTADQKKRFELFTEAEKILASESPIAPIYSYTRSYLKKPYLKGFWPHFQDRHEWKYMWIDERWYKGVPENREVDNDQPWLK
jgi:oligopeptide transport system substrate-binding protein